MCVDLLTLGLSMSLRRLSSVNNPQHGLLAHDFVTKRSQGSCHIADEFSCDEHVHQQMWSVLFLMWPKLVFQPLCPRATPPILPQWVLISLI